MAPAIHVIYVPDFRELDTVYPPCGQTGCSLAFQTWKRDLVMVFWGERLFSVQPTLFHTDFC